MTSTTVNCNDTSTAFFQQRCKSRLPTILTEMRQQAAQQHTGDLSARDEVIALLTWLARLIQAKRYLEIGIFTGLSSTAMALSLPEDGELIVCDINVTRHRIAQQFWQRAGVAHKIKAILQPALITMNELIAAGNSANFDLIFIDADKLPINEYFEKALVLARSGGLIVIDNLLLNGKTLNTNSTSQSAQAMRYFLQQRQQDTRIDEWILPLGDGLSVMCKQ